MKETTRRSGRMPKRYSNSSDGGARCSRTLLLAVVVSVILLPELAAQQGVGSQAPGAEVPSPVLTSDTELSEAEAAIGELSRRVSSVAEAVEEEGTARYRAVLEDLRGKLDRWSDTISAMSVEPAEDSDIDRRRFRRFERRMRSSTADVNAAVDRINESLEAASTAEPPEDG